MDPEIYEKVLGCSHRTRGEAVQEAETCHEDRPIMKVHVGITNTRKVSSLYAYNFNTKER